MDWLFAVVVFVLTAIVCGIILLIRHLKGEDDSVVSRFILSFGAFLAVAIVFISAVSDIRERFPKLTFSFVYVVVVFTVLLTWFIVLKIMRYKEETIREFEYRFSYRKTGNMIDQNTGDDITRFLKDYGFSENRFKEEFVSSAIRSGIAEYRRKHPLDE